MGWQCWGHLLQASSTTFLFPSLKCFHHLRTVGLCIISDPQSPCKISNISLPLFMTFTQNLTGHLYLKTHKISFSSTNDKWGSSNTRISTKLTLKCGIMLLASRPHHHIAGHNVMHNLLDLDYCRKAAMPVSLLFRHPSYKKI